jgi:isoleucyl-tRNA synthetase
MAAVMSAVSPGRSLRSLYNIKMRQPLNKAELVTRNQDEKNALVEMAEIIREELNVKELVFSDNEEALVEYEVKANFRVLGKELGKDMKAAAACIEKLSHAEIQSIINGISLSVNIPGENGGTRVLEITADKLDIRRNEKANLRVLNEGTITVGLDTEVTHQLSMEGCVRDLIRGIQNARKEMGFSVTDRIELCIYGSDFLKEAWEHFGEIAAAETLAVKTEWNKIDGQILLDTSSEKADDKWLVKIQKAGSV